jgi:glutamate transport system substrate-binding protein
MMLVTGCNVPESAVPVPEKEVFLHAGVAIRPPFVFRDESQGLCGSDVELLKLLAASKRYRLEITEYPLSELVFALRRGEIDIIAAGFTERELTELFISPCGFYMKTGQRVLINSELAPFINSKSQLDNSRITVYTVAGSSGAEQVKNIFPSAESVSLKNASACIEKVKTGKGNIFLLDARDAIPQASEKDSGLAPVLGLLSDEVIAWGVRRKEVELRNNINDFIEIAKKSGDLQKIIDDTKVESINR